MEADEKKRLYSFKKTLCAMNIFLFLCMFVQQYNCINVLEANILVNQKLIEYNYAHSLPVEYSLLERYYFFIAKYNVEFASIPNKFFAIFNTQKLFVLTN